jgi:SWI/SNF-related matrix-associated actin-dependent regulator of chromatin subfamily A3
MAAILAPLLDRGVLQTEGTVAGDRNAYTIPISIELFTKPVDIEEMEHRLRYYHISKTPVLHQQQVRPPPPPPVQPPRSQYISSSAPAPALVNPALAYNNLVRKSVAFDPRAIRDVSEKFGMSIDDLQSLPMAKQPEQVSTKMLDYQLQGLKWMLNMEHPRLPDKDTVKQFWTKDGNAWINVATH